MKRDVRADLKVARDMGRATITAIWHGEGELAYQVAAGATDHEKMAMIGWLSGQVAGLTKMLLIERGYTQEEWTEEFQRLMTEIDNREFLS